MEITNGQTTRPNFQPLLPPIGIDFIDHSGTRKSNNTKVNGERGKKKKKTLEETEHEKSQTSIAAWDLVWEDGGGGWQEGGRETDILGPKEH